MVSRTKSDLSRQRRLPAHTRAAIVTVLATFGFFEYYTWSGLFRTSGGLPVLICVEVGIGSLGAAWVYWELRRSARRKGV